MKGIYKLLIGAGLLGGFALTQESCSVNKDISEKVTITNDGTVQNGNTTIIYKRVTFNDGHFRQMPSADTVIEANGDTTITRNTFKTVDPKDQGAKANDGNPEVNLRYADLKSLVVSQLKVGNARVTFYTDNKMDELVVFYKDATIRYFNLNKKPNRKDFNDEKLLPNDPNQIDILKNGRFIKRYQSIVKDNNKYAYDSRYRQEVEEGKKFIQKNIDTYYGFLGVIYDSKEGHNHGLDRKVQKLMRHLVN
jgi:hypothetical protein